MRKIRRFAPWGAAAALVLALLAYGVVSYRVADGIIKLERKPLVPPLHEEVSFRATDGLLLYPDKIAPIFLARGWDVLLFDLRGHGESEGDRYSLGQYEPRNIIAAIDFAATKSSIPKQRVAVIGESLGAGSAIMTVAVDPTIGPIVTDSAYADAYTVVSEVGTNYTGLPSWFTPRVVLAGKPFFGLDVASVKPSEVVRPHPERAWLFIQCEDDKTVFAHHGRDLVAASANARTELWMVSRCDHVKAFTLHPAEWQQRVITFLDREIGRAPSAASR